MKKSCAEQRQVVGISDTDPDLCPPIRSSSQEQQMLSTSGEASGQATPQVGPCSPRGECQDGTEQTRGRKGEAGVALSSGSQEPEEPPTLYPSIFSLVSEGPHPPRARLPTDCLLLAMPLLESSGRARPGSLKSAGAK